MKTPKILIITLLTFAMALAITPHASAGAQTSVVIDARSSPASAEPGGEFEVTLTLSSNPGLATLGFQLRFDSGALELLSLTRGPVIEGFAAGGMGTTNAEPPFGPDVVNNAGFINFNMALLPPSGRPPVSYAGTGHIATVRFRVLEGAAGGTAETLTVATRAQANVSDFGGVNRPFVGNSATISISAATGQGTIPGAGGGGAGGGSGTGGGGGAGGGTGTGTGSDAQNENGAASQNGGAALQAFSDVSPGAWYHGYVSAVTEAGLFQGTAQGTFSPHSNMTRAMFAQVLANLEGAHLVLYTALPPDFDDVAQGQWYFPAVQWAADTGIIQGMGEGNFAPDANVTREQMAAMLYRYAQQRNISLPQIYEAGFADQAAISGWAMEAVNAKAAAGIVRGRADGSFAPQATATRAEVAAIFARFLQIADD